MYTTVDSITGILLAVLQAVPASVPANLYKHVGQLPTWKPQVVDINLESITVMNSTGKFWHGWRLKYSPFDDIVFAGRSLQLFVNLTLETWTSPSEVARRMTFFPHCIYFSFSPNYRPARCSTTRATISS